MMFLFSSFEEKMLMLGDFDLNSTQRYTDSLKDIFKQTILDQEIIFRKQVHELHRLYSVQKTLMKDLVPLELGSHNSWKANAQPLPQETRLSTNSIPMVGSAVSLSQELLEGWKGRYHKFEQRLFDLQLLPDQCISFSDNNLPNKGKVGDKLKETMDVNSLHGGDFSDPLELRLSLSLGVAKMKKEDKWSSWYDKKTNTCSRSVIDLEESSEQTSDDDAKHPTLDFAAKVMYSEGKKDSQVTITSNLITSRSTVKDLSHEIAESSSFGRDKRCCPDWSYSDQGLERHESMSHENFLTRKRQFISYGVGHVDLNEVQLDDSSCHSNDALALPSSSSSSGGFNGSVCRSQIDLSKDLCSHNGNTENGRDELMSKLPNAPTHGRNPACAVAKQVDCERIEEGDSGLLCSDKIQITMEDKNPDVRPALGKSSCISDNAPSPLSTMRSEIEPYDLNVPASDQFSGTDGRSQVAETLSGEQDQRSSDSNEIKHECCNNGEESAEVDDLIQIAAESLIHISLENSACYQEASTQTGSNELENQDKEQPQCSSDSFELMTLKLKESSADDYCVSSKPFEVSDAERKDFSFKLRRGRRMKDFQRDILPSLASLSRHEIHEDINILEGVLRSREYKKMRAKMGNGESWCTPLRSRRSRLNYVGRKSFR